MANDFDIVAIPWAKKVKAPRTLMRAIEKRTAMRFENRTEREYGRVAYTCTVGFGVCRLDFSFWPIKRRK